MAVPCPQFALLLMLLFFRDQVLCKRYDLQSPEWATWPLHKLNEVTTNSNLTSYQPIIHSENGVFVFASVASAGKSSARDLALVMQQQVRDAMGAVVVNRLIIGVSSFEPLSSLLSNVVTEDVSAMELLDSGNLIFYNVTDSIVWQSFDHSRDILLSGQPLKVGMHLESPGYNYTAKLRNEGLVFHMVGVNTYFTWASGHCNGQQPTLKLDNDTLSLCDSVSLHIEGADNLAFIQLNPKGDIVNFYFNRSSLLWVQGKFSLAMSQTQSYCTLPGWCEGRYRFCSGSGSCTCSHPALDCFKALPFQDAVVLGDYNAADRCETRDGHYIGRRSTTHFSIFGKQPDFLCKSQEECLILCTCSTCSAVFYNGTDGSCYLLREPLNLVGSFSNSSEMTAFIWVPSSKRQIVLRIITIFLLLAYIGPPFYCLLADKMAQIRQHLKNRFQRLALQEEAEELERVLGDAQGHLPQRFRYASLKAATENFSDTRKLGAGGFGVVYEAVMDGGQRLAVKELGGGQRQGEGLKQFVSEIASMGSISHLNVLRLHGFCIDTSHRLLVYDYMPNSSLDRWLFNKTAERCLSWQQRQDIALGVARGLAYLHGECREPILHLDVKPQNILLDDRFVAKVADFGMAKLLADRDASKVETNVRGTPGYIAPEWCLHSIATKKCDVYSYGMVLLELISGRKNLDLTMAGSSSNSSSSSSSSRSSSHDNDDDSSWYFPAWAAKQVQKGRMMRLVDERIAGSVSEQELRKMIWLAFWCIQERASLRPAMQEAVLVLEGLQEVKEPPLSFRFAFQGATSLDFGEGWFTASQELQMRDEEAVLLWQELAMV